MNFGATNQFSPDVQISDMYARTGARNHGSLLIFGKKSDCPQNLATWTVKQDSGETENYSRKPSENYGEHPEESTDVFDHPAG